MSSLLEKLDYAITQLGKASDFAKPRFQSQVLELSGRVLAQQNDVSALYERIPQLHEAGIFAGTDWASPQNLIAQLVPVTLQQGQKNTIVLDCLSQLRMLAIVNGELHDPEFSAEQARAFLSTVISLNLNVILGNFDESFRIHLGKLSEVVSHLYRFLLDNVGYDSVIDQLVNEVWRILAQRPIQVTPVKIMIAQIAAVLYQNEVNLRENNLGIGRLISALYCPTQGCIDDPGLEAYELRLQSMDQNALQQEASGFARAMHDIGLVSDYHAAFVRWLLANEFEALLPATLGLSSTGIDALSTYKQLIHTLIEQAVFPATAQCVYGLAMMLEKGVLYVAPVAPSLWRQIRLELHPQVQSVLEVAFGYQLEARIHLLAGAISLLGQPLGVAQGNNPTCQSARAISMWSYNDPDYLLNIIARVARHNNLRIHFEGQPIDSDELLQGLSVVAPLDTDPVSIILVPHLDKLYIEMGKRCADRDEDPHKWINPEFHGWYVGREFYIAVDVKTGMLKGYENFVEQFYRSYHPLYNGNIPVIHPQPVGIAITDSLGKFVGWHAVTLIRIALDLDNVMRVYFYNPNNDSGQNWGNGVVVSTQGKGERHGEASLPFPQFVSRLYIYHDDAIDYSNLSPLPQEEIYEVQELALNSWAVNRYDPANLSEVSAR